MERRRLITPSSKGKKHNDERENETTGREARKRGHERGGPHLGVEGVE